jgi:glycosyltransferase involved in cell wall biosynthesis
MARFHNQPAAKPQESAVQERESLPVRNTVVIDWSRMRISFVVPAYNEEGYLERCLRSILAQTEHAPQNFDIIVVNNASTDRTRAIAASFPRVRVVDEPRKGLTYARQAGFDVSTGDYIANVDADSVLTPGWVDEVIRNFTEQPRLAAISGPVVYYELTARQQLLVQVYYFIAWSSYAINRYLLRVGSMIQGGNFVVSRRALEAIGGFDTSIAFYGEDTDIARRISKEGPVLFTLKLKMFTSARRLHKEGILRMAFRYSINYFWTTFFKKPYTQEYIDIREQAGMGNADPSTTLRYAQDDKM